MPEVLLEVRGLTTRIAAGANQGDSALVVDGVDLSIRRGETFALLGESGCGKSMTALSLMRLLPASARIVSGTVSLAGTDLLQLSEARMRAIRGGRMGMIFQEPQTSLNPVLTVGDQIGEAVQVHEGRARSAVRARVIELLAAVGIPDPARRVDEYPHQLSGGMKQRVMIAIALAGDPQILIADEPTTALDVTIQAQVLRLLKDLQTQTGLAVLVITHDLGVVAETADRLAVMYAGQIVETGPVAGFFAGPAHPYSRKLLESVPGEGSRGARLAVIPGRVPRLDQSFVGCRFAPRCPLAEPACEEAPPEWQGLDEGRGVRCRRWQVAFGDAPIEPPAREARPAMEAAASHWWRCRDSRSISPSIGVSSAGWWGRYGRWTGSISPCVRGAPWRWSVNPAAARPRPARVCCNWCVLPADRCVTGVRRSRGSVIGACGPSARTYS